MPAQLQIVTATLTTVGLGLTAASPATAAPDNDIDAAKTRVDRLAEQADTAAENHDRAAVEADSRSHQGRSALEADQAPPRDRHRHSCRGRISAVEEVEEYALRRHLGAHP